MKKLNVKNNLSSSSNNDNTTRVVCPKCGTAMAIPSKETIMTATVIAKNSGLGTVVLQAEEEQPKKHRKPVTPAEKIEALKAAGVDTSKYFTMPGADGIYMPHDGTIAIVDETDPIIAKILSAGDAPVYRLFRRWVMGQMFHMLRYNEGFQAALNRLGYYYSWRVVIDEFNTQTKLWDKDREYYWDRHRWYNKSMLLAMVDHFKNAFEKEAVWKGGVYTRILGVCYTVDYAEETTKELMRLYNAIYRCKDTGDEARLAKLAKDVMNFIKKRTAGQNEKLSQGSAFQNAYKGAGGFYTMQNLIRFHGCRFNDPMGGKKMTEAQSLAELDRIAREAAENAQGYKMLGALKAFLKANKIDIDKKIASWTK